ncbi:hypothetical protein TVAG_486910 [Trichomonas vaginalis G3]|uniref:Nucleotide-diphospho-sugar transferase domain-containing protein n=1 Tax=Trichomonas vaginalis (strain ATCC PRA-98 / G3) TaxID=412133 RepID=A2DZB9_TRIV3|nr:hypothetical protein TVAGG3_1017280 [Trichomonas vaginalis G3]EAY14248.1 hypothetical protein TVAG_486910 [Trichomonas vaginalis G3]KAI5491894.1 hypothetical protein TVAGG3_1017280 [Trichomonas vaginalis G3]|eukprot:XP_001326471.1 hypothetical protein [Trichomonas vaginalis G3]
MNASFPPCNFQPVKYKPNSTPDDLFISYAFKNCKNLASLARTFRHTGTNASAVFFIDDEANSAMTNDTRNLILSCGVTLINVGKLPFSGGTNYYHSAYMFMTELVRLNIHKLNRVIKSDGFDTFFQGDPFIEDFREDSLLLYDEHYTLKQCPFNRDFIKRYGYKLTEKDNEFYYICAGFAAGKAEIFLNAYWLYLSFVIPDGSYTDQGGFNYFILTGMFEKYQIPFITQKGIDNVFVRHCARDWTRRNERLGTFTMNYNASKYALVVHHSYLIENVKQYCPAPHGKFPDYFNTRS